MHGKTVGVAFVMNCQDARESLSMLLDGDLGLTERVPLEIHVNMCVECRQRLADLQIIKVVEEKPAPRPAPHWPPILAAGLVGRALGAIRTEDTASRLRRFVIERFPPRQLAAAAAVPLVIMLAIFIFERGFAVGTAMRQPPSSAPAALRSSPPIPPSAIAMDPVIPTPRPPTPSSLAPSTASPTSPAQTPAPPRQVASPPASAKATSTKAAETKAVPTKAPESKAVETQAAPRSAKTDSTVKAATAESTRKESLATARALPSKPSGEPADPVAAAAASRRGAVDVVGRLHVKSRSEAERDLAALLARAGGTSVRRQHGRGVTVVEAAVPQASYGTFSQGLVRIGSWRLEAERSPLPDLVQVSVRLAD